jgi:tetratricopeptide (TPR) repeat protein
MKTANQDKPFLHILLIIFLSLIAYSNTFESSFHFDGEHYIVDNPVIRDLSNFTQPSSSRDFSLKFQYETFSRRYLGYLSFALNYRLHGLNVAGYHFVNLLVHMCTAMLAYFFVILTFKTPFIRNSAIRDYAGYIALFTALLFACHPLQTQAVTYIWQRVTSLCTMFYLLSLVAYIKWRLYTQGGQRDRGTEAEAERPRHGTGVKTILLYLISLICTILAMKTKEIAFMLPVVLMLYEFTFFAGKIKKRVLYLIPFLLTMLIIPLITINFDKPVGEMMGHIESITKGSAQLPRGEYLLAQFRVLVTYLRLTFLPVNQNLDYDYPRYYSFFNIEVFSSFVFLAILFGLSIYILFRYRDSAPHTRLISFGIIWFFVNLLLESSIIPLNNVIFEHRMYLPSVGVFLALSTVIFMVIDRWKAYAKVITMMLAIIIIVLTGATYARNTVWKDEITLWQDVVNKSPDKERGYSNLGTAYEYQGLIDMAIEQYLAATKIDNDYPAAHYNLGNAYESKGLTDAAIRHYQKALKLSPTYSKAYNNLGNIYLSQGLIDEAIEQYLMAIKFKTDNNPNSYINLGNAYESMGSLDKAMAQYQNAVELQPNHPLAHYNIGKLYQLKGFVNSAIEHYLLAIKSRPDYPKAHHNLGVAYKSKGLLGKAIEHYLFAIKFRPDYPKAHHNLGNAYMVKNLPQKAIKEYQVAIKQDPSDYSVYDSLGDAYQSRGMNDKATESYRKALELRQAGNTQD